MLWIHCYEISEYMVNQSCANFVRNIGLPSTSSSSYSHSVSLFLYCSIFSIWGLFYSPTHNWSVLPIEFEPVRRELNHLVIRVRHFEGQCLLVNKVCKMVWFVWRALQKCDGENNRIVLGGYQPGALFLIRELSVFRIRCILPVFVHWRRYTLKIYKVDSVGRNTAKITKQLLWKPKTQPSGWSIAAV